MGLVSIASMSISLGKQIGQSNNTIIISKLSHYCTWIMVKKCVWNSVNGHSIWIIEYLFKLWLYVKHFYKEE